MRECVRYARRAEASGTSLPAEDQNRSKLDSVEVGHDIEELSYGTVSTGTSSLPARAIPTSSTSRYRPKRHESSHKQFACNENKGIIL